MGWATDVVAEFFGDDWFRRNLENFSHPLLSMYDHPLSNRIAAVRHIERAARIALLPEDVKGALSEGPNGICRSASSDEFDHLDIVLEVIGLALRDGWEVGCEVPTRAGRLPDVRAARSGFAYSIEVTAQGFDRNLRATRRQGDRLSGEQFRIEFGRAVECVTRVVRLLSDEEFSEYVSALDQAAVEVSDSHHPTESIWRYRQNLWMGSSATWRSAFRENRSGRGAHLRVRAGRAASWSGRKRSLIATAASHSGHAPPGPTLVHQRLQSSHRCEPR
jgi:hypothetical protein